MAVDLHAANVLNDRTLAITCLRIDDVQTRDSGRATIATATVARRDLLNPSLRFRPKFRHNPCPAEAPTWTSLIMNHLPLP
jgi:hypothetical protein